MDKNPKRTYRKRKKVDLLMALSFLIIGATFIVTLMTFIFPVTGGKHLHGAGVYLAGARAHDGKLIGSSEKRMKKRR